MAAPRPTSASPLNRGVRIVHHPGPVCQGTTSPRQAVAGHVLKTRPASHSVAMMPPMEVAMAEQKVMLLGACLSTPSPNNGYPIAGSSSASTASTTAPASPIGPVPGVSETGSLLGPATPSLERRSSGSSYDNFAQTPPKAGGEAPHWVWRPQALSMGSDSWTPQTPRAVVRVLGPSTSSPLNSVAVPRTPSAPSVGLAPRVVGGHSSSSSQLAASASMWPGEIPASWTSPPKPAATVTVAKPKAVDQQTHQDGVVPTKLHAQDAPSEQPSKSVGALNVPVFPGGYTAPLPAVGSVDAVALSAELQSTILRLYMEHLLEGGKIVDYDALRASKDFSLYVEQTAQLAGADLTALSQVQLKVFTLNIYNALVIHGMAVLGGFDPNVKGSIAYFFSSATYLIGGHNFTLDDLEHGILRGNKPHPTSGRVFFKEGDERIALALDLDPRVHCALVCGAKSCPPIRIYEEDILEEGLDLAVTAFCDSEVNIDEEAGVITMNKIFQWYGRDFGSTDEELVEFLANYMEDPLSTQLREAAVRGFRSDVNPDGFVIKYTPYDWSRNGLA